MKADVYQSSTILFVLQFVKDNKVSEYTQNIVEEESWRAQQKEVNQRFWTKPERGEKEKAGGQWKCWTFCYYL